MYCQEQTLQGYLTRFSGSYFTTLKVVDKRKQCKMILVYRHANSFRPLEVQMTFLSLSLGKSKCSCICKFVSSVLSPYKCVLLWLLWTSYNVYSVLVFNQSNKKSSSYSLYICRKVVLLLFFVNKWSHNLCRHAMNNAVLLSYQSGEKAFHPSVVHVCAEVITPC